MNTSGLLPYGRQTIDDDDVAAVATAMRDDFLTGGPRVEEFERAFAKATGAAHAVACNSGTAALHLAALALDLSPSDAAIVPTMTFLATANAARMTGADVFFADVDADTGLMTAENLKEALARANQSRKKIKAAFPVHLNGQVCDMIALGEVARAHGMELVEDACHALGVAGVGETAHSRLACFSTHPVKAIATGEGGVVTTADETLARRMRGLRSHGMSREAASFKNHALAFDGEAANPWYYEMAEVGWNYRMPDILCALGISQLKKLSGFFLRRREIATLYDRLLAPLAPTLRPVPHSGSVHGWHLYVILVDFASIGMTRAQFMRALRARAVGTQVHYIPVHRQPYYRRSQGDFVLPGADAYYARCLSIPMFPAMSDDDVKRVAATLEDLVQGARAA